MKARKISLGSKIGVGHLTLSKKDLPAHHKKLSETELLKSDSN